MLTSSTSSSSSSSSCSPNPLNHDPEPPAIPPSPLPAPHNFHLHCPSLPSLPHPRPALVIPFSHCHHHLHTHPNHCSPRHLYPLPQASIVASSINSRATSHSGISSDSSSSRSFTTDPHCYTADCSPRSVIRHVHSSSSGPSPDPGRPNRCSREWMSGPSTAPRGESQNLAGTSSSMISTHHPALHEGNRASFMQTQGQQFIMQRQPRYIDPPWSSPTAEHRQRLDASSRSLSANSERRLTSHTITPAHVQNASHMRHEVAETEKGSTRTMEIRQSDPQKASSKSAYVQREGQYRSANPSGSARVGKPGVNGVSDEVRECNSEGQSASIWGSRPRSDAESDHGPNAHVQRYRAPGTVSDCSQSNRMQWQSKGENHRQRILQHRSYNSDTHDVEGGLCNSWRQGAGIVSTHNASTSLNELAPRSPDALLGYVDGVAGCDRGRRPAAGKGHIQFRSKWEDAERWLRPAPQHSHPMGYRSFIPNLSLLRMSECMNAAGTAIQPHCLNAVPVDPNCPTDYVAVHSSCGFSIIANYNCSMHAPALSSAGMHNDCVRSTGSEQAERVITQYPSSAAAGAGPFVHVDCFTPHLTSYSSNLPHAYNKHCSAAKPDLASSNQALVRGEIIRPEINSHPQQTSDGEADQSRECSSSKAPDPSVNEWDVLPLPFPRSAPDLTTNLHFTDKFASGEPMPSASREHMYATSVDPNIYMPNIQERVVVPLVSLRDVGTQMSSIDGSGSISRYTSENGSPPRNSDLLSPSRHNTPAGPRSLSGSASNSGNQRTRAASSGGMHLSFGIDLRELAECHRAKLELQARLSVEEAEQRLRAAAAAAAAAAHHHDDHFHQRTASNWSSREAEEADLSRSLRHSTPELENQAAPDARSSSSSARRGHLLPCFPFSAATASSSWTVHDDEDPSKLAKLQAKEARIQAWENKMKSKADAKLKRLEENLAKKRSATTMRIKESLAAAQKKVEEMRASAYAQQRRSIKREGLRRGRSLSLSPLPRCTCFSAL